MSNAAARRSVERFVLQYVRSPEELDILLLLFRAPGRWWSAGDVAAVLHLNAEIARCGLERLSGAFLDVRVESQICFRFSAHNCQRDALTAQLEATYHTDRGWLMSLFGNQRRAVMDFADAFRLRKEDKK
jgi:hypothetical protein